MGLSHWQESDNAADADYVFQKLVNEFVEKELLDKANEYNTPGFVNIALLLEDERIPIHSVKVKTLKKIVKLLDSWKKQFKKDVDRMQKFINDHLKTRDENED